MNTSLNASQHVSNAEPQNAGSELSEQAQDVLLSVDNVTLTFGGVKAISDISFNICKGEIRAIIGPNGAGKTSMLNVINGFYHPQQGRINYKGKTRRKMKPTSCGSQCLRYEILCAIDVTDRRG